MIDPKEITRQLRIGNLVKFIPDGVVFIVSELNNFNQNTINGLRPEDIEPIEITEEWLIKLGFKQDIRKPKISYKGVSLTLFENLGYYLNVENCIPFNNPIKYIHQLQNLYFVLTGEELKINE